MINEHKRLDLKNLSVHCGLSKPQSEYDGISMDSDAKLLMVDFTKTRAITANESITVNDALELMRANRIHALMVVDDNSEFSGVITAMDLMGSKPMIFAGEAGISRIDVMVKNIMVQKNKLSAITIQDVEKSRVGDVLQTLMALSQQHLLVINGQKEHMKICGLFSASDFKKALRVSFNTPVVAQTFYDLERIINEKKEVI